MSYTIDIAKPRECIYPEFENQPGPCPRCGSMLAPCTRTYLVATRRGNQITDSFIVGNDMGWFCAECPTVVINPQDIAEMFQVSRPGWDAGDERTVVGILDWDAIPPRQRDRPLDEVDPMPLADLTRAPEAPWSSDRSPGRGRVRFKDQSISAAPHCHTTIPSRWIALARPSDSSSSR
jgi:hypothetical protein